MKLSLIYDGCCGETQLNVCMNQGESVSINIKFPFDITGYSFISTINFPDPLVLTNDDGIEIIDAALGTVLLNLTSAQTQDITPGQYQFDFWAESPGNFNTDPITGIFNINPSITQIS